MAYSKSNEEMFKKAFVVSDTGNLQEPTMPLGEWLSRNRYSGIRVTVERVNPNAKLSYKKFKIRYENEHNMEFHEITRSANDFVLLHSVLDKRFPGAFVPVCPARFKNNQMLEIYLKRIAVNPYFRNDSAFRDFFDERVKQYKSTKKTLGCSEGTLRWHQTISGQFKLDSSLEYLQALKKGFDSMSLNAKTMTKALTSQANAFYSMQVANIQIQGACSEIIALESDLVNLGASALPDGSIFNIHKNMIIASNKNEQALDYAFNHMEFKRILLNDLDTHIATIGGWKAAAGTLVEKAKALAKAESQLAYAQEKDSVNIDGLKEKCRLRSVDFQFHCNGLLGVELPIFRNERSHLAERAWRDYGAFYIRAAKGLQQSTQTYKEFDTSPVPVFETPNFADAGISREFLATSLNRSLKLSQDGAKSGRFSLGLQLYEHRPLWETDSDDGEEPTFRKGMKFFAKDGSNQKILGPSTKDILGPVTDWFSAKYSGSEVEEPHTNSYEDDLENHFDILSSYQAEDDPSLTSPPKEDKRFRLGLNVGPIAKLKGKGEHVEELNSWLQSKLCFIISQDNGIFQNTALPISQTPAERLRSGQRKRLTATILLFPVPDASTVLSNLAS